MLNLQEVQNITDTIDKAEISFSHLREDLIDHVCCEIESQMAMGFNFNDAFDAVKPKLGIRDLQKIQEGTLLLIDKKYRIMKQLMKISGIISIVCLIIGSLARIYNLPGSNIAMSLGYISLCLLFLPNSISIMRKENKANTKIGLYVTAFLGAIGFSLGIFFKVMHWPGAGILLTLGITIISLLFFPFLWVSLMKNLADKNEKKAVFIGIIGGSLHFLGTLFKMMHWPGASIIFILSVVLLVFIFVPFYMYIKFKEQTFVNEKFIYIIFSLTFLIILTLLIQVQFAFDNQKVIRNNLTTYQKVIQFYSTENEKAINIANDSVIQSNIGKIHNRIKESQNVIDSSLVEYIQFLLPGKNVDTDSKQVTDALFDFHNSVLFESVMFDAGANSPALRIKRNLNEILTLCQKLNLKEEKYQIMESLLSTKVLPNSTANSWEDILFRNKQPIVQYQTLLYLKQKLVLADEELVHI